MDTPIEYPVPWMAQKPVARPTHEQEVAIAAAEAHVRSLPRRKLLPSDIPNEPWRDHYGEYELRADGAIFGEGLLLEFGTVSPDGTVNWIG